MTPQPRSRVKRITDLDFGVGALKKANPELITLAMRAIAGWSHVELELAFMIAAFVRADFKVVSEMYCALTGSTQRKAVRDAAASRLPPEDRRLHDDVMAVVDSGEGHRLPAAKKYSRYWS